MNLPIAAAALLAVPRVLPAFDASAARPAPNVAGATLATASLLLLVFTVVETESQGWTSARSLLGFAGALVLAAVFFATERRSASPLLPRELLGRTRAMWADGVVFIAAGGLLAMFFFMTLYLQQVLGLSALERRAGVRPDDQRAADRRRDRHRRDDHDRHLDTTDAAASGADRASALVEGFQAAFRIEAAVMLAAALLAVATLRRRG